MTHKSKHKIGVPKKTGVPNWAISYSVMDDQLVDCIRDNLKSIEALIRLKLKS